MRGRKGSADLRNRKTIVQDGLGPDSTHVSEIRALCMLVLTLASISKRNGVGYAFPHAMAHEKREYE